MFHAILKVVSFIGADKLFKTPITLSSKIIRVIESRAYAFMNRTALQPMRVVYLVLAILIDDTQLSSTTINAD
jgi:hypothetical protein